MRLGRPSSGTATSTPSRRCSILDGSLRMTIGEETRELGPGDACVVNRGVEHELYSEDGVTFIEALAPVPLDHIGDRERDLVLGDLNGSLHVER